MNKRSYRQPSKRRVWQKAVGSAIAGTMTLALALLGIGCLGPQPTAVVATMAPINTPTATTPTPATATSQPALATKPIPAVASLPDITALQEFMRQLVNHDRANAGLSALAWDSTAAAAALDHAQDMAENGYMSHWNLAGHGPDYRYSQAGGPHTVQENVYKYWYGYDDGRPAPILDWEQVVREAEAALMDSPGHRSNILNPDHTHVGIGMTYNPTTGSVCIAQEFVNYYVNTESLPSSARLGETLSVRGQLLPGATEPLVNLAYEPFPETMSLEELATTSTYVSPAEICSVPPISVAQDTFHAEVMLDCEGRAGLYHVRIWVKVAGRDVPATDVVIEVE